MSSDDYQQTLNEAYKLLQRLGISSKYRGYHHAAYSILLCVQQPDRILLISKYVYPAVAKRYRTNWQAVERNIRTINTVCWRMHPELLCELSQCQLAHRPTAKEFIAILSTYLLSNKAAEVFHDLPVDRY